MKLGGMGLVQQQQQEAGAPAGNVCAPHAGTTPNPKGQPRDTQESGINDLVKSVVNGAPKAATSQDEDETFSVVFADRKVSAIPP